MSREAMRAVERAVRAGWRAYAADPGVSPVQHAVEALLSEGLDESERRLAARAVVWAMV